MAGAVGFIALGGVAAEIGVVMLVYLNQAIATRTAEGRLNDESDLAQAIIEGAALRVRPIAMTVAVIIAGLLPIMFGSGTGSEVMQRIAAPMVGGMITAPLLSMFVVPAVFLLIRRRSGGRGPGGVAGKDKTKEERAPFAPFVSSSRFRPRGGGARGGEDLLSRERLEPQRGPRFSTQP